MRRERAPSQGAVRYAELHALSNFSFLRGASHPQELIERADELGYSALALTDECSVAGVVRAHMAAKDRRIRLIVGAEFRLECGLRIVLLAIDRGGYGRLCRLITRARRAAPKGCYRLTRADLGELPPTGCFVLWLPEAEPDEAAGRFLRELCGSRLRIGVELLREGRDRARLARLERLGRALAIPLVATGDVHMHRRERRRLQDALTAIRLRVPIGAAGFGLYANGERYLREPERLARLYPPALLEESVAIAEGCRFRLDELRYEYPHEIVPAGETPRSHLRKLVEAGARWRWPDGLPEPERRAIDHELALIADLDYEPYFLTVHDIVAWARARGILCQGRGSAANSRVCYCLGITSVDPQRGPALLFERFISRERNEPPDIDIDFEHERREEVIQYVYGRYGRERAALAGTVIMYRPRSALRDLGRIFGLDPGACRRLTSLLQWWDAGDAMPARLKDAGFDPAAAPLCHILPLARTLTDFPGFPRHLSQHVGGFVISEGLLEELVPVENAAMADRTVVQWDKDDLNDLGLLKVDLLALGMLTALRRAFDLVNATRGTRWALGSLPPEDRSVYEMICRADTVGVFQIESRAQMAMLPRLKPRCYYDLVIEVAIVRPGPIQGDMVHPYLRRRETGEAPSFPSPEVESVLQRTLGVPIFQEQVMQLAIVAAGFSPGEADALRRAMGAWKRSGGIDHFRDKLLAGMLARGYDAGFAERIYRQMLGFGEYGFPECVVGSTRVIDADSGRWVTVDEVMSGQARLENTFACDPSLRLRKRRVVAVRASGVKPVWRITTRLGHQLGASANHPLLTPEGWRKVGDLREGHLVAAARALPPPRLVGSDISWDRIVSVVPAGEQMTYDLEIEGDHNFLANDLVVHNSHAASFALLVYDSAWLKCHEPAAFTCALLNSQPMGFYAPAQLVRDARAHGVEVRPVDVCASDWDCSLEDWERPGWPALRLGMRLVRSLKHAGALQILKGRAGGPFASVQDLARRAGLDRGDLEALAAAGALARLSGNRHLAFWEVAGTERELPIEAAAPPGDGPDEAGEPHREGHPLLPAPTPGQGVVADYAALGLTLGTHPMALLRERLRMQRLLSAAELQQLPHGRPVRVAGIVLMRQRPQTASGVTFVTLEDESGQVNVIVWSSVGEAQRRPLLESRLLEVHGELQRQHSVTHVVAHRLVDRSRLLGELTVRSRDFH